MRAVFVFATVVIALLLGMVAAAFESRLLIGALIVGVVFAMWALPHVIERGTGRDMWDFSAPYPHRWMHHHGNTGDAAQNSGRKPTAVRQEADARSNLPLPA